MSGSPQRRRTGWFAAAVVLVFGGAAGSAIYAWSATSESQAEFWTVAVPGLATGAGTLVLALATVWTLRAARIDRELERQAAEKLDAGREARKVRVMLQHRPAGATFTVFNAGQQPILDVLVVEPSTPPDSDGVTYEWKADSLTDVWPGEWFEHSLRAPFVPAGGDLSIKGNIYRVDADGSVSAARAGDGQRLESQFQIAWTDWTNRKWMKVGQKDPQPTH